MNIHDKRFSTDLMRGQEYFYHHVDSCIASCWKIHAPQDMIGTLYTMCYRCTHEKKEVRCFNCGEWLCIICYSIRRSQTFVCWKCGSLNHISGDASIPLTSPDKIQRSFVSTVFPDDNLEDELVRAMISHFVELIPTQRITTADELLRHTVPSLMSYDLNTMHDICSRVAEKIDVPLSRTYFDDNWNRFGTLPQVTEHTDDHDIVRVLIESRTTNSSLFISMFERQKWVPIVQCHVSDCSDEPLEQCLHCRHQFCSYHLGIQLTSSDNPMISCCIGICSDCRDSIHSRSSCSCHSVSVYTNDQSGEVLFHVHAPSEPHDIVRDLIRHEKNNASDTFSFALHLMTRHVEMSAGCGFNLSKHNRVRIGLKISPLFHSQFFHLVGVVM